MNDDFHNADLYGHEDAADLIHDDPYQCAADFFEECDDDEVVIIACKRVEVKPEHHVQWVIDEVLALFNECYSQAREYALDEKAKIIKQRQKITLEYLQEFAKTYTAYDYEEVARRVIKRSEL